MATITQAIVPPTDSGRLRAFDARRDLARVADLIERCFADTLDPDGQRYLQQMRSAARNRAYLRLTRLAAECGGLPQTGFVWEEQGEIVGNLTLIPFANRKQKYYLIANVAVHPEQRRRGIARQLTKKALDYARQRGAQATWLHVRTENTAAYQLYQSLGFGQQAERTTWVCNPSESFDPLLELGVTARATIPAGVKITPRHGSDWRIQRAWLEQIYPAVINWHLTLDVQALQPGWWGMLYRLWNDLQVRQWAAWRGERLLGFLAWQAMPHYADSLWLAARPNQDDEALSALLVHARRSLSPRRALTLDYPAGHAAGVFEAAGFRPLHTLVWMSQALNQKI
jgi:ribosomal protein S18 acetylase RimI-like enzyme